MSDKNVSELLNIVQAGGGLSLRAEHYSVDDILPLAKACGDARVHLEIHGALDWRTSDLIQIAKNGKGMVILSS